MDLRLCYLTGNLASVPTLNLSPPLPPPFQTLVLANLPPYTILAHQLPFPSLI